MPAPSLATLLNAAPLREAATGESQAIERDATAQPSVEQEAAPSVVVLGDASPSLPETRDEIARPDGEAVRIDTIEPVDLTPSDRMPVDTADTADTEGAPPLAARRAAGPRFLHRTRTTPVHTRRARGQWAIVAALALSLCLQVVIADRARLATQAGWRPVVVTLCGLFRCDVPTWREPTAFSMLSRDVRPIAGAPGTLQAQATFRNEARWAQAWPVILLTLKDADGRTLGARALQPADYLPEGEALGAIGPGQSAQMAVRIREPSASVVAFSFDFR